MSFVKLTCDYNSHPEFSKLAKSNDSVMNLSVPFPF